MPEVTSTQWMHSCYDSRPDIAILTVKEKTVTIDTDKNEILNTSSKLRQFINPKRKVWITKPEYRKHRYKKESEIMEHCDVYVTEDRLLIPFLKEKMDVEQWRWITKKKLCKSPYIYGTDISMEALVRYKYESLQEHTVAPITIGALDIESSMIHEDRRTNCITVVCDKTIYTAALREFVFQWDGDIKRPATVEDMLEKLEQETMVSTAIDKAKMTLIPRIFDTEIELYKFIFEAIQKDTPDYMFIWNLGYDVPQIIKRLNALDEDPKAYFCDPSLSTSHQYLKYYEDKRKTAHIIQKWNWLHCTSMTQWLDAMALYGQVRKTKPKESSYKLEDIMSNLLKLGKVDLKGHSHQYMQEKEFVKYWVYNIWDAVLVQLGGWKSLDYNSLYALTEHSTLMDFSKQTVMLSNDYHHALLADGRVFASTGSDMANPYDHLLSKVGGAVLDAKNVTEMGINCVIERPEIETNVLLYSADDDYEGLYPNWKIAGAIAKENKLSTVVAIAGHPNTAIESLFSALSDPHENAVWIGSTYFGLRDYSGMTRHIQSKITEASNDMPF